MSKYTGVTFANQKVSPSDDAIIRRAILPDGKLTGCNISYSGSTLTMSAGHLMVCGRQLRNPAAQNWPIVDKTSGYARLVLTIDLTRTSTKDTFDQVVDSIEYASSQNGFVTLEQADINGSGTRYQVAVCTVSLGTGGITGIVSQLEKCEVGAGLNFKVVGGTTQPTGPKENTIWVNTSTTITDWIFSATQPTSAPGRVWFSTGTSSVVKFNALKKNQIQVYPIYAKQYVSGNWVNKTAKTYKSGTWKEWSKTLLPASDILSRLVTGGQPVTPQYASNVLTLSLINTTWVYFEEDVSAFNTLEIIGNRSAASTTLDVGILNSSNNLASGKTLNGSSQDFTVTCDISALTGKQRIGVKSNLNSQTQQTTVVKATSIVLK